MAADELEAWELAAMRDPRNWARPAAAVVVGTAAGARARRAARPARQQRRRDARDRRASTLASARAATVAVEARKLLDSRNRTLA